MQYSTLGSAAPEATSVGILGHHATDDLRDELAYPPHMQPPHSKLALAKVPTTKHCQKYRTKQEMLFTEKYFRQYFVRPR